MKVSYFQISNKRGRAGRGEAILYLLNTVNFHCKLMFTDEMRSI